MKPSRSHRFPVDLAWKKPGKTIQGRITAEIPDLSHLALPLVAEFLPQREGHTGRVWRGDETGLWTRIDRTVLSSSEDFECWTKHVPSLADQFLRMANLAVGQHLDGIAIHNIWIPESQRRPTCHGVDEILENGGGKALEDARWSMTRYAVIDGALWRRHPGPLLQLWQNRLDQGSRLHWDSFYGPFLTIASARALVADRPDVDADVLERFLVHRPELASGYDVDGLNLEKTLVHVRDLIGAKRVEAMDTKAMKAYARLVAAHSDCCPEAPRKEANLGWLHDNRAFELPFRAELFPLLKEAYETCLPDLHPSRRPFIESALDLLEPRWKRDFEQVLSREDEDALTGLAL